MSINTLENKIKFLNSEIERLGRALEQENKRELSYEKAIRRIKKTIGKNTSMSQLKNKKRTIDNYNEKIFKSRKKQEEISSKLNKERLELSKKQSELQDESDKGYERILKRQAKIIGEQKKMIDEIETVRVKNIENLQNKEYDFFISHASEDKEIIAEPLAEALINKGAKVWYDKFTLSVGDSLRKSIDAGLASSRYGIVILSEPYFKKFWTGEELNGLFAKQESGQKVILPVWHNISKDMVKSNSPMLADMLALKTADFTVEELADEFIGLI